MPEAKQQFETPTEGRVYERFPAVGLLLKDIDEHLPDLAQALIVKHKDTIANAQSFLENPDDPNEHQPAYHQWGVISHTRQVLNIYRGEDVKHLLTEWEIFPQVQQYMQKDIDGIEKRELFAVAILAHDLGKFATRTKNKHGGYSFAGHEIASGEIVRKDLQWMFMQAGLTEGQVEYIARCSELHFELGKLRRGNGGEFTQDYVRNEEFERNVYTIMKNNPEYALEIGLFHLVDSLGKADVPLDLPDAKLKEYLGENNLPSELSRGVRQVPINVAMAREYLALYLEPSLWATEVTRRSAA